MVRIRDFVSLGSGAQLLFAFDNLMVEKGAIKAPSTNQKAKIATADSLTRIFLGLFWKAS